MRQAGLSFEQAPPFSLPLRFFLTAPLFLMLAAVAALPTVAEWTASRWSLPALALTHLITLGFLGQVMMGALLQMLPVVIGSPVSRPRLTATLGHIGLTLGTLLLAAGLAWAEPTMTRAGLAVLIIGWSPLLGAIAASLLRARPATTHTLYPMRQAVLALLITLGLGIWLAGGFAGWWAVPHTERMTGLHAAWGLLGWVLLLVMGVAYQVVPMLQITPAYPALLTRWLTWVLLAGLVVYTLTTVLPTPYGDGIAMGAWLLAGAAMVAFAWATLDLLRRRRRRLPDVTLDFWRFALACLILLALLPVFWAWLLQPWQESTETAAGLLFLLGFAASVVSGMLYKIVPFLAWFHLQSQTGARAGTIPNMKEFIADTKARRHLRLHVAAVLLLVSTPFLPPVFAIPGLLLLAASAHVLWVNLLRCGRLFERFGGRLG